MILDVDTYQTLTGALSDADRTAAVGWCEAMSAAIADICRPWQFEPVTYTNQIYDAPVDTVLFFRKRPVRTITSIYYNPAGRGAIANFTSGFLLAADGSEYMLDNDDDDTGYSMKGAVIRANREWGARLFRPVNRLGRRLEAEPKSLLVNFTAGFTSVPSNVQGAVAHLVTKNMRSRKHGSQVTSASLNGAAYSLPAGAVGQILDDPFIRDALRRYLTVHVG